MGQSHLDILQSASSHSDLRGGYFGKRSNLIFWSAATGLFIGVFFYFGCTSGVGTVHMTNSAIFGGIWALITAWVLRSNAKAVQRDYIRMMRIKGIDDEILTVLKDDNSCLESVRARFDKAIKGEAIAKERDVFKALNALGSKR